MKHYKCSGSAFISRGPLWVHYTPFRASSLRMLYKTDSFASLISRPTLIYGNQEQGLIACDPKVGKRKEH